MKKVLKRVIILLLCIITISYFLPTDTKTFQEIYETEDEISASYKEFNSRPLKTVTVENIEWNYYSGGEGDKTILFLHGMGGTHAIWWQQIISLERHYRVISYTLPEPIANLQKVKNGIEGILENENITTFYAIGSSMGGYITQYLMQEMPQRMEKVILGNTFAPNNIQKQKNEGKSKIIPILPEIIVAKLAKRQLTGTILPAGNNSLVLKATLGSIPFNKTQFVNRYNIVVDSFSIHTEITKHIDKLIIESNNDPLVEEELRIKLKKTYTDAKVYTFRRQGHFPYVNEPETYNSLIREFFEL